MTRLNITRQYQELHVFQALPRFVFSFGQRHPKCVPVTIEAPGLGMLTGAVPTFFETIERNLCVIVNTLKSLHQHDNNSPSTVLLRVVPCLFFFLFASTSTRSLIRFLTKYEILTV